MRRRHLVQTLKAKGNMGKEGGMEGALLLYEFEMHLLPMMNWNKTLGKSVAGGKLTGNKYSCYYKGCT